MSNTDAQASMVGSDILNLITTGMYHSPLTVYREYIQNTADAVGSSSDSAAGRVEISIDPARRRVTIRDNGPGLSHVEAVRDLVPIARSRKQHGTDRGFRGIGRLSGLAFAETVTFRTRATGKQPVSRISWDGTALRTRAAQRTKTDSVIQECVEVTTLDGEGWPSHFFEVEIVNIARHAAGLMLNCDAVRAYISEVCPVPMSADFPFAADVEGLFDGNDRSMTVEVFLAGDEAPVTRRLGAGLALSEDREDLFVGFRALHVPAVDGDGDAAVGWLIHSSYLGAIPKGLGVRGLRARQGNIQVGDEKVFDAFFPEERFNRWCIGEVHIVDPRIVPNGRRDYFEQSPHTRNLENHLDAIIRGIVNRCRKASATRNRARKLVATLDDIESAYDLAGSGYLMADDARALIERTVQKLEYMQKTFAPMHVYALENVARLKDIEAKLTNFQPRRGRSPLGSIRRSEINTYQRVFHALTELSPSAGAAKKIIEAILAHA